MIEVVRGGRLDSVPKQGRIGVRCGSERDAKQQVSSEKPVVVGWRQDTRQLDERAGREVGGRNAINDDVAPKGVCVKSAVVARVADLDNLDRSNARAVGDEQAVAHTDVGGILEVVEATAAVDVEKVPRRYDEVVMVASGKG